MADATFDTLTLDQQRFVDALLRATANFVIVGGYALRASGCLRVTNDLDVVVSQSDENLIAVGEALFAVDAVRVESAIEQLRSNNKARITWNDCDVFPRSSQFTFAELLAEAIPIKFDERSVFVMSRSQLIAEKRYWSSQPNRGDKGIQDQQDLRRTYLAALEKASVGENIAPFAEFLAALVEKRLAGEPLPEVPKASS